MSQHFDEKTKTWYCSFRYYDHDGVSHQTKKRGFKLKREAKEYEDSILAMYENRMTMKLSDFADIFLADRKPRVKEVTYNNYKKVIDKLIKPYLGNIPINKIESLDIRNWLTKLADATTMRHEKYTSGSINNVATICSMIFRYGVKFYGLKNNPVEMAREKKRKVKTEMKTWSEDEFVSVLKYVDSIQYRAFFSLLFYSGLRAGEAIALNVSDIDFENNVVSVTKTHHRIKRKDVITPPKTPYSVRDVIIPDYVTDTIKKYIEMYSITDRIFNRNHTTYRNILNRAADKAGVQRIRVHDLRHSHVSMLIHLGIPVTAISKRVGHESPQITLARYSHLYNQDDKDVVEN